MIDGLEVTGLHVQFARVVAVERLSLQAPSGAITGLIGPNGAGKTTTFNACCGVVPHQGRVSYRQEELTNRSSAQRARLGLGRTFQRTELCDGLSVLENVTLGAECRRAGARPWTQVISTRTEHRNLQEQARGAIRRCGISHLSELSCGQLSTGQRRLVELARTIASGFTFVLLDEPSSGLDHNETVVFGELLLELVANGTTGLLIVEHDMSLVRQTCDSVYVLDFGELVISGNTEAVLSSEEVKMAYLGEEVAARA